MKTDFFDFMCVFYDLKKIKQNQLISDNGVVADTDKSAVTFK